MGKLVSVISNELHGSGVGLLIWTRPNVALVHSFRKPAIALTRYVRTWEI